MLDPLRRLIDAVPRATLAEIIFEMLAAEPAKRRPGRPRKPSRPRGRPRKPPAGNGADPGEAPATPRPSTRAERRAKAAEPAAKALWEKAAALSDAPWSSLPSGSASIPPSRSTPIGTTVCHRASRSRPRPPSVSGRSASWRFRRERRARGTRRQAPHRPPVGSREPRVENRELREARLEIPQGREGDNECPGPSCPPISGP